MKKITILVPAYNEEESLPYLYDRVKKIMDEMINYEFELLFVNDGSKDNTLNEIKKLRETDSRVCYVDFSRNFGKEIGMIAGLDYATGDCVIIMDADLQDPPELIPQMVELWEQGYDDVYAQRKSRAGETWLKKFTSKMYYRVLQSLTKVQIQKDTGDFRLLDRRCVNALKKMRETGRCSKSMFSWIGYNKKAILYDRDPRIAGKTKWNYMKLIDLAIDGITSFSARPMRWIFMTGIVLLAVDILVALYVFVSYFFSDHISAGWASLMLSIWALGSMILIAIGVVGEYIGKIFVEVKHRPRYAISDKLWD